MTTRILVFAVACAAFLTPVTTHAQGAAASSDSIRRAVSQQVEAARQQAAEARREAAKAASEAEAAGASAGQPVAQAPPVVSPPGGAAPLADVATAIAEIVLLALLVLLWFGLGRPPVRRWLAERHGAHVLLLWGAVILYTFVSCAARVASVFTAHGGPEPTVPLVTFAWFALLIVTWRWATARGAATRVR